MITICKSDSLLNFKAEAAMDFTATVIMDGVDYPARIIFKSNKWSWDSKLRVWVTDSIIAYTSVIDILDSDDDNIYKIVNIEVMNSLDISNMSAESKSGYTLRDDQIKDIEEFSNSDLYICGDEQGTGKMVKGCKIAEISQNKVIIVTPNQILYEWEEKLSEWLKVGKNSKSIIVYDKQYCKDVTNYILPADINIIPFSMLHKVADGICALSTYTLIIDEVHNLTNTKSRRGKALNTICKSVKIDYLALFSGTLIVNSPAEIYNLFTNLELINLLKPATVFKQDILGMELQQIGRDKLFYGKPSTDEVYLDRTRRILEALNYKRRLRSEILDIPDKLREVVNVTKLNYTTADRMILEGDITNYEQETNYFKLCHKYAAKKVATEDFKAWFLETISKTVVFYKHKIVLDTLCEYLRKDSISYTVIEGGVNDYELHTRVDSFQNGDKAVIFVPFGKTEGLTLTAADSEIFAELPDTLKDVLQAEDRVFRHGLDHVGTVYYPIDYKGAEARKLELLKLKAGYSKVLEKNNGKLSIEEILED